MKQLIVNITADWNRFWFAPTDPSTLATIRISTGMVLLCSYIACTLDILDFIGPNAWVDAQAMGQMRHYGVEGGVDDMLGAGQSIWFYVQHPVAVVCLHGAFLLAILGFTVGWWTRTMNVAVWVGHLSFIHRAVLCWSGMDTILAMLTFYLMFAPAGAVYSVDCRRQPRCAEPVRSWPANTVIRLIQIHMCIIYLCAGLSKLQGARWWDGTAVWTVMMLSEFAPLDMSWLGHLGDVPCLLLSNVGVASTLTMEISFAFLIWNPRVRPKLLLLAFLLHNGIGLFMGLESFGAAMLTGCLAFVPPDVVRSLVSRCQQRLEQRTRAGSATIAHQPARAGKRAA